MRGDRMANSNNLIPQSHELTPEERSKGGRRSAEVRQKRQQLRNIAQAVLNGSYTDEDGQELTGSELITKKLTEVIQDTNHKYFMDVVKLMVQLTDSDKTEKELELSEKQQQSQIDEVERNDTFRRLGDCIIESLRGE